ncbi:hypothetical protein BVX98_03685, partial [bacterium F11]
KTEPPQKNAPWRLLHYKRPEGSDRFDPPKFVFDLKERDSLFPFQDYQILNREGTLLSIVCTQGGIRYLHAVPLEDDGTHLGPIPPHKIRMDEPAEGFNQVDSFSMGGVARPKEEEIELFGTIRDDKKTSIVAHSINPRDGSANNPPIKKVLEEDQKVTIDGEEEEIKKISSNEIPVSADGTRFLATVWLKSGEYVSVVFNRNPENNQIINGTRFLSTHQNDGIGHVLSADGSQAVAVVTKSVGGDVYVVGSRPASTEGNTMLSGHNSLLRQNEEILGVNIGKIQPGVEPDISEDGLTVGLRAQVDGEWSTILLHLNKDARALEDISVLVSEGQEVKKPDHYQTEIKGSPT